MPRIDILIRQDQKEFLRQLKGTSSEHIRRAIDEYIQKMKNTLVSTSPSKKGVN